MIKKISAYVILLLAIFTSPSEAELPIYSYIDAQGMVHYTNINTTEGSWADRQRKFFKKNRLVTTGKFHQFIQQTAKRYNVDPLLIKAIIKAESNFNPKAVSTAGAMGLMQLMPGTAKDLQVLDPFDIQQNIEGGTRYFKQLLNSYDGNVQLSLAAYNAGPSRVKPQGNIPFIAETRTYIDRVMNYYRASKKN